MYATRRRRPHLSAIVAVCTASFYITSAVAAEDSGGQSSWGIGVAGTVIKRPYRGIDDENIGLPLITYENRWVSVSAPVVDLKAFDAGPVSIRLRARYALDGYDSSDSSFLEGMDDRKNSAWAGLAAVWRNDIVNVGAEVLKDASSNSDGTRASVVIDHRFLVGSLGITPRVSGEWVDSKYVRYYYGVRTTEARQGRTAYDGDATANLLVGIRLDYSPAEHHTLFLDAAHTRYGSGIKDSPVVDRAHQRSISVGYLYRF